MRNILFNLLVICLSFSSTTITAQTTTANKNTSGKTNATIAGAWRSQDGKEFSLINDGFFSSVAQDSTGKWTSTHAGTYTVDDASTITLKVLYSSYPDHIGALHSVGYSISGETLTMNWFKKLIDSKAGDITAQMPKGQQTQYIRAKQ